MPQERYDRREEWVVRTELEEEQQDRQQKYSKEDEKDLEKEMARPREEKED